MRRLTLALAVAIGASLLVVHPTLADHNCHWREHVDPDTGEVILELYCPPHEDGTGDGDGGGETPEAPECGPWFPASPPSEDEDGSRWREEFRYCEDGGETVTESRTICVANCPGGGPDPGERFDGLLDGAIGRLDPPLPGMRASFDQPAQDGEVRAVVNAESWWWAEATAPVEVYDEDGAVWVRVTASAERMVVDPGDGSETIEALRPDDPAFAEEADCPLPGLVYDRNQSYYDQVPGKERGACVHVYEQAADEVTATMTVTWALTYEGFIPGAGPGNPNVSGAVGPQVREQALSFPVKEIQSVIVR